VIVIPAERQAHLDLLAGSFEQLSNQPWPVWHEPALAFLADLGKALMKPALAAKLPDVVTLAYWLRAANLQQLKAKASADVRVGLGLVVHICPANVPVNFAFSLAFALLAGNSSVLRLSSKPSPSTDLIVQHIQQLLATPTHAAMRSRLLLLRYAHDDVITAALLAQAESAMLVQTASAIFLRFMGFSFRPVSIRNCITAGSGPRPGPRRRPASAGVARCVR